MLTPRAKCADMVQLVKIFYIRSCQGGESGSGADVSVIGFCHALSQSSKSHFGPESISNL